MSDPITVNITEEVVQVVTDASGALVSLNLIDPGINTVEVAGIQGPQGIQGPAGPNGTIIPVEVTASQDGAQLIQTSSLVSSEYWLHINGLEQSKSNYSVSGMTVTIPSTMNVKAGDVLTFEYIAM